MSANVAGRSVRCIVLAIVLAGCGGSDPGQRATPADVSQAESLNFVTGASPDDARTVPVVLGKIVILTVSSDAPGVVRVDGYGVTRSVQPGAPAVLIFSADRAGAFDVRMSGEGTDVQFARIEVEEA